MLAAAEAEELREAAALRTTVNVALAFFTALVATAVGWYGMNRMREPGGGPTRRRSRPATAASCAACWSQSGCPSLRCGAR